MTTSRLRNLGLNDILGDPAGLDRAAIVDRMRFADAELCRHAEAVAVLVAAVVSTLPALSEQQQRAAVDAAWLHDIGKLTLPRQTLQKSGPLTEAEWIEMRRHPELGATYLSRSSTMAPVERFIRQHHEWHNGRGYPIGLPGNRIALEARLISIADAYDAMTSWRPYRPTLPDGDAIDELQRCAGTQFDPELVTRFIDSTDNLRQRGAQ